MTKTVAFTTLGCKVNSYETEAMRELFEVDGYEVVDFKDVAQIYVINTCTVTNLADRKSRQMINQARNRNPEGIIAAVGCYVQGADQEELDDLNIDIIIGNNKKSNILSMVYNHIKSNNKEEAIMDINNAKDIEGLKVQDTHGKTRAFIRIQEGCNRFCSYCIIPYVRGRIRSKSEKDIISEISYLANKGFKEVVLTGIHISSYGDDFTTEDYKNENKPLLGELIKKINEIKGIERIRLGSLEPNIITRDFANLLKGLDKFCPHFHLSLQSGSTTVLKRMNRRYTSEQYYDKVEVLKDVFEHPSFTTDIIVGFPQETEDEFKETKDFVRKIGFNSLHVFKYSKRTGTKAATMDGQVPGNIKNERSKELIKVAEELGLSYRGDMINNIENILVEEEVTIDNKQYYSGHNEKFIKLIFEKEVDENLLNRIVSVEVKEVLTEDIVLCTKKH